MENETVFASAFYFKKPREGAPDFVKGSVGIKVDEAIKFLQEHKKEDGFVNLDLLKSKEKGTLYFKLNTFKPKSEAVADEDIPF